MKRIYLLTLCIISVVQGIAQAPNQGKHIVAPSLEGIIPVKAGDAFTIRTTATRIGKKNSVLKTALQVIGTGAAAYQSTRTTIGKGAKEQQVNNRDWVIPAGIVLAFTADKIPGIHQSPNSYIKYTLYSKDGKRILQTGITKLTTRSIKQQGGIMLEGTATEDGFLVPEIIGKSVKGISYNNIVVNIEANKSGYSDKIKPQVIKPVTLVPEIRTGSITLPVLKSLSFETPEPAESTVPVRESGKKTIVKVDAKKRLVPVIPEISKGTAPVPGNSELQQGIKPAGKPVSKPKQKQPGIFFPLLYYKKEEFGIVDEEEPGVKLFKKKRTIKLVTDPWLRFLNSTVTAMESDDSDDGGYGINEGECDDGCTDDGTADGGVTDSGSWDDGTQPGDCDDGCSDDGTADGGWDDGGMDGGTDDGGTDGGMDDGGTDGWDDGGFDDGGWDDSGWDDSGWDDGSWDDGFDGGFDGGFDDGFDDGTWDDGMYDDGIFDDLGWDDGIYDDGGGDDGGTPPDPPVLTIADIQGFRNTSTVIADLEAALGITSANLTTKVVLGAGSGGFTTATSTDPNTTSYKIHIGKDQSQNSGILAYAHELSNAANISVIVGYLNTARNNPKTPANKTAFLDGMAKVEAMATFRALLVAIELNLPINPTAQACYDKVKATLGNNPTVTTLDALNFIKAKILDGTLKGDDGNPIIDHYSTLYDQL